MARAVERSTLDKDPPDRRKSDTGGALLAVAAPNRTSIPQHEARQEKSRGGRVGANTARRLCCCELK